MHSWLATTTTTKNAGQHPSLLLQGTMLHSAASTGSTKALDTVELLLSKGVDVKATNDCVSVHPNFMQIRPDTETVI